MRDVENRLRGAVVLLEHDLRRIREVVFEGEDVAHVCAPEAVHGLVVVAHNRHVAMLCAEDLDELVLRLVGVLVLVDEQVKESILVVLTNRVRLAKQRHGAEQQVVEIQR